GHCAALVDRHLLERADPALHGRAIGGYRISGRADRPEACDERAPGVEEPPGIDLHVIRPGEPCAHIWRYVVGLALLPSQSAASIVGDLRQKASTSAPFTPLLQNLCTRARASYV